MMTRTLKTAFAAVALLGTFAPVNAATTRPRPPFCPIIIVAPICW